MECELEALGVKPASCASLNVALHLFSNDDLRYMESMYVELDCKPELGCTLSYLTIRHRGAQEKENGF